MCKHHKQENQKIFQVLFLTIEIVDYYPIKAHWYKFFNLFIGSNCALHQKKWKIRKHLSRWTRRNKKIPTVASIENLMLWNTYSCCCNIIHTHLPKWNKKIKRWPPFIHRNTVLDNYNINDAVQLAYQFKQDTIIWYSQPCFVLFPFPQEGRKKKFSA